MACFNGAAYIREQIVSLQAQNYGDWRLIVHDDGSMDGTPDIVRGLASADGRIKLFEDGVRFGNAGENFLHCLRMSDAPYIMFCDQDDVWFPDKIETMLSIISSRDQSIPQVVYSQSDVWNPVSGISGHATLYFADNLRDFLFLNSGVQGCAAIFNACARVELLKWSGNVSMHDHLLQLICVSIGEVCHIDKSLMLYRRHGETVTGDTKTHQIGNTTLRSKAPVVDQKHFETISRFAELYADKLPHDSERYLSAYLSMPEQNFLSRFATVIRNGFHLYGSTAKLLLKMIVRPFIG